MTVTSQERPIVMALNKWMNPRSRQSQSSAEGFFELSTRSTAQLAGILKERHGLGSLADHRAAFRADPGVEIHPDRTAVSCDGFTASATREARPITKEGWLLVERYWDGDAPGVYMRIRSFTGYRGALAELTTRIELCARGSLAVAESAVRPGESELHFEGEGRALSLIYAKT
jgi:hypothetical protein